MSQKNFTQLAFTESVKQFQQQHGSRNSYAKMETAGDKYVLTEREKDFIAARDSFYMATVGSNGWPYVQFRGGPAGFLRVIDDVTLAFADFRGNRQYISTGNITDTQKASLILVDYPARKRLKIWAEAKLVELQDAGDLVPRLLDDSYEAVVERVMLLQVQAYDWNCPQHIRPRYTVEEIAEEISHLNPDLIASCCPEGREQVEPEQR